MGRPRNDSNEISTTERIENAFWELLEKEGYKNITILRLAQESGVNRNSIYYHYENVEDLAKKAFEHNSGYQTTTFFMSVILESNIDFMDNPEIVLRIKRLHLLARSESSFLQLLIRNLLVNIWFDIFNIDSSLLSDADYVALNFIAAGVTDMLGSDAITNNHYSIRSFPYTLIGKVAVKTLQSMSQRV